MCKPAAFIFDKAVGLKFHLESSRKSIIRLIKNCGDELIEEKYIQSPEDIRTQTDRFPEMNRLMTLFLLKSF